MKKTSIFIIIITLALFSGCSRNTEALHNETEAEDAALHDLHEDENISGSESHGEENEVTLLTIKREPFSFILRTGGRIMVDSRDIEIVTAKSTGIVKFSSDFLFPGVQAIKGKTLFNLVGGQLTGENTELRFKQIKSDLDKATANYERASRLIEEKIITEESFLSSKNEYEKLLLEYNNLNETFGSSGNIITVPSNGYIKDIFVTEGQKVTSGDPLASIVIEHNLVLKADISPGHIYMLPDIENANFTVGYSNKVFKTSEMNGRVISFGRSTGEGSFYVPLYFRMDPDPALIEGTFAEVYLIGKEIREAIVLPNSALMEEFGKLYVFIVHDDGDYIKRYITAGGSDGERTLVLSGLEENEIIVASGAYQIKLARMTTSAPSDVHNH